MERLLTNELRRDLTDAINRVKYAGERIILRRRNTDVAALVSVEDLALLEEMEDRADAREARRILAAMKRTGEKPIPWEEVKAELAAKRAGKKG